MDGMKPSELAAGIIAGLTDAATKVNAAIEERREYLVCHAIVGRLQLERRVLVHHLLDGSTMYTLDGQPLIQFAAPIRYDVGPGHPPGTYGLKLPHRYCEPGEPLPPPGA